MYVLKIKKEREEKGNTGIISKLRHYLPLLQLKQLYYTLIDPYITYAIIAWGSAYKTHLD